MSYNVLCEQWEAPHKFPYANDQVRAFKFRAPRVIAEIGSSDASMICLQEVDNIEDFYDEQLKKTLGLEVVYGKRMGDRPTDAIAYKPDVWQLLASEYVEFKDIIEWIPDVPQDNDGLTGWRLHKCAILCLFKHKPSN